MRTGFALAIAGGAMTPIFFYMLWMKTNDAKYPFVRRMFQGCRLMISGIVTIFSLTFLMLTTFAEANANNTRPDTIFGLLGVFSIWVSEMCLAVFFLMISRPQATAMPGEVPAAQPGMTTQTLQ